MSLRNGPEARITLSCFDCLHCTSTSYAVQGDSGHDIYCEHHAIGRKRVGDTRWDTPAWCPLRAEAIAALIERETGGQP